MIEPEDVMAAKDGMIFDLTNQVLQLKAQNSALNRELAAERGPEPEPEPGDEEMDEALASTNGNLNAVPSSEN